MMVIGFDFMQLYWFIVMDVNGCLFEWEVDFVMISLVIIVEDVLQVYFNFGGGFFMVVFLGVV